MTIAIIQLIENRHFVIKTLEIAEKTLGLIQLDRTYPTLTSAVGDLLTEHPKMYRVFGNSEYEVWV